MCKKKKETQEEITRKYNEVHYPQGMGGWEWGKKHGGVVVWGRINNFLRTLFHITLIFRIMLMPNKNYNRMST